MGSVLRKWPPVKVGETYERFTVIGEPFYVRNHKGISERFVVCKCGCGKIVCVRVSDLNRGRSRSCGCLQKETVAGSLLKHGHGRRKHNGGVHPIYHVWLHMRDRCRRATAKEYKDYGGRGITVCEEWNASYQVFYDWAIAHGWARGLYLDRTNNDGNYEPGNCRFVTPKVSGNNQRRPQRKRRAQID